MTASDITASVIDTKPGQYTVVEIKLFELKVQTLFAGSGHLGLALKWCKACNEYVRSKSEDENAFIAFMFACYDEQLLALGVDQDVLTAARERIGGIGH